ncbi:MAG: tRNA pseudouridine(13) synthase TruD [Gammaproteobacteria bacterium]|nr:tRNA pseudouridine(13) synthase TruD [Gammaproteobacteria bacterium]
MYIFSTLHRAYGQPLSSGLIKTQDEDFRVDEIMPVVPSGEGEHLWLQIQKTGCNTDWLARQLAQWAQVKPMAVSYAGLKDRHGVTSQWFSIHLPGQADPDLSALKLEGVEVLQQKRHDRKLKRGTLSGNCFKLWIRNIIGDRDELEQRLLHVSHAGIPNYFGEQRFGHGMANLEKAERLFQGGIKRMKRHQRSIYLSAARSWIFNRVLSERVAQGNWNRFIAGDVLMLDGKNACFTDDGSVDLQARVESRELHPTGPLWGRGHSMAESECGLLEQNIVEQLPILTQGLEHAGLKQERRALRLIPDNLNWQWQDEQTLELQFCLPSGTYATMLVRELVEQNV